jgi:hypothetical protein
MPPLCAAVVRGRHFAPPRNRVVGYLTTPEMQQGRWRGGVRRFLR